VPDLRAVFLESHDTYDQAWLRGRQYAVLVAQDGKTFGGWLISIRPMHGGCFGIYAVEDRS
jgi:hypothetical protein